MQISLTLDLTTMNPKQIETFVEFVLGFTSPYFIPSSDELAEALEEKLTTEELDSRYNGYVPPSFKGSIRKIPDSPTTRHAVAEYPGVESGRRY